MAGRIPQNFIDDLISRLDIIDVVSARTRLKQAARLNLLWNLMALNFLTPSKSLQAI
jgi:hypothetical protein